MQFLVPVVGIAALAQQLNHLVTVKIIQIKAGNSTNPMCPDTCVAAVQIGD